MYTYPTPYGFEHMTYIKESIHTNSSLFAILKSIFII